MFLQSLASAVPANKLDQSAVWDLTRNSPHARRLKPRSLGLLEKILLGPSGIDTRHIATADPAALFAMNPAELNAYYELAAPALAARALEKALASASLAASGIDALFVCSCTGYLCPGPSSHIAEQCGLRPDAWLADLIGLGCGAALPALRAASHFLAAHPDATVAVVAVEICSAAFFLADDPAVLISYCLFGDAASASLWSGRPAARALGRIHDFQSIHHPEHREKIRFTNDGGFLRNQLDRQVPRLAADAVAAMLATRPDHSGRLLCHPGGRDVLDAIESAIPNQPQHASRHVLRHHGNCSSPSVLLALEHDLLENSATTRRTLAAFGAGFSCHTARFECPAGCECPAG